jgi:hypothetical protein
LALSYEIQKHFETDRYDTLDQLYKRAAQIGNIIRKEQEKMGRSGEKRKEPMLQNVMSVSNHVQNQFKKHKPFGVSQEKGLSNWLKQQEWGNSTPEAGLQKTLYDRKGKEIINNCRKYQKKKKSPRKGL